MQTERNNLCIISIFLGGLLDGHINDEYINIVAGRIDIHDMVNGQEIPIESFLIHPNYTGIGDNHNDICLLTLDDDLEFNDNVKAIALNNETVDAGTKCIVSGWGTLTVSSSVAYMIDIGT